ncbi:aerotolerance regulator BatC [Olleya sp. YS]|uniref:aerotolerance regulator BatC n=1 Tax=Olleya sp. YS TaxID=3028318 RepID=UPI0024344B0B|nr:aerotolerance regulator BatC [Olleya sp. YS]WGD35945.1 aerotolerance regulator BatC [Olleya sp. YS]
MKHLLAYILFLVTVTTFAQDKKEDKQKLQAQSYVAEANDLAVNDAFVEAEMEYRKALSLKPTQVAGAYNLGHQYFKKGNFEEALFRHQQAAKNATSKEEKYRAFHNIGNILMEEKKCKQAVEAYKTALRNKPSDDETRYNYAVAKECADNQKDDEPQEEDNEGDNNRDKEDNKDENQKENNEKEQEDKGEDDKKEGDQDKDKQGEPKDEKENEQKEGDQKNEQKQPQPGQLSPQQIKNLLEAMNNQEQKVQEKINAQKVKGAKLQTEKDW